MATYLSIPEEVEAVQLKEKDAEVIKQNKPCIVCPVCNISQPYEEGDYRVTFPDGHIQVMEPADFKAQFKAKKVVKKAIKIVR